MVTCPKCKAENRPEAAFCSRCGTILFAQPTPSKIPDQPITTKAIEKIPQPAVVEPRIETREENVLIPPAPQPVEVKPTGLQPRPEGSVFADRFQYDSVLEKSEHEVRYTVTDTSPAGTPPVRICSNTECRTVHCPVDQEVEKYCTQCGYPLEERSLVFLLRESDKDEFSYTQHVLELNLVHPNILPPVATFQDDTPDGARYCLVTPYSSELPTGVEISQVLDWGKQLATALDYMQSKGIVLGDAADLVSFGLMEDKVVWRNINSVRILPMLTDREKINNIRHLALALYNMMSGKTEYHPDPYLPDAINDLFEKALLGEGFTSGADLVAQIDLATEGGVNRLILDYQVGRRSHPGKMRTNNEDSLLSLELSSVQQGTIKPSGIFVIADGLGGHAAGELASSLVISTIAKNAPGDLHDLHNPTIENHENWLNEIIQSANQAVYDARQKAENDMGSTLAMCLLIGTQAYLAHIGDSRIYMVNQRSIQQLTTDHSLVQHMVSNGQISQEEARYHPQRNVIYRSLGEKPVVEVDCLSQQLFPHDRLLLCSDGLSNSLDDEQMREIILNACSPQAACDQLVEAANASGGEDNISAILVEIISVQ